MYAKGIKAETDITHALATVLVTVIPMHMCVRAQHVYCMYICLHTRQRYRCQE